MPLRPRIWPSIRLSRLIRSRCSFSVRLFVRQQQPPASSALLSGICALCICPLNSLSILFFDPSGFRSYNFALVFSLYISYSFRILSTFFRGSLQRVPNTPCGYASRQIIYPLQVFCKGHRKLLHTCRSAPALRHARRKPGTGFSDAITGACYSTRSCSSWPPSPIAAASSFFGNRTVIFVPSPG